MTGITREGARVPVLRDWESPVARLFVRTDVLLDHWDGVLYPPGTPPRDRLAHYVRRFDTVELNASFYRWPRTATFASWRRRLPPGFGLSVKAPRGLTHAKKLYAPEVWVERMVSCWHELGDRRAVLLVQMHPAHERDDARLDYFLSRLPDWMRVAVEFRHPSWHVDGGLRAARAARRRVLRDERRRAALHPARDRAAIRFFFF